MQQPTMKRNIIMRKISKQNIQTKILKNKLIIIIIIKLKNNNNNIKDKNKLTTT